MLTKIMKRIILILLVFIGITVINTFNFEYGALAMNEVLNDTEVAIFMDGERISFDSQLQIINDRVIVPAWQLYEMLGATVEWREDPGIMVASIDETKIAIRIDNDLMVVNGQFVKLEVAPRLVEDKLFVPIRAICENFGAKVEWDEATKTIKIIVGKKSDFNSFETEKIDINDVWKIEEKEDFVMLMSQYISEKCEYGDKIEKLNDEQRVFYITQAVEMEVNNGGFSQFFFNSDGVFANEIVVAFEKIGAIKTAEICKKALSIFGDKIPTDRDEIQSIITPDDEEKEEKIEEMLNECDNMFFEYEDVLVELNYIFIINNKESFLK